MPACAPDQWLAAKRASLLARFPEIIDCLDRLEEMLEMKPLEARWLKLAEWKWKKGARDYGASFQLSDERATRFLVALKRLGLIDSLSLRYEVEEQAAGRNRGAGDRAIRLSAFVSEWTRSWPRLDSDSVARCVFGPDDGPRERFCGSLIAEIVHSMPPFEDLEARRAWLVKVAALHVAAQYAEFFVSRFEMLRQVEVYAGTRACRKQMLLGYFGSAYPYEGSCRRCDNCGIEEQAPRWLPERAPALELLEQLRETLAAGRVGAARAFARVSALEAACARLIAEGEAVAGEAMLTRELEERPGNLVARFARALLVAAGSLERRPGLREQHRHDIDAVIAGCLETRAVEPLVRALVHRVRHHGWHERPFWEPFVRAWRAWPLAAQDALLLAMGACAEVRTDRRLALLVQALWLDAFERKAVASRLARTNALRG